MRLAITGMQDLARITTYFGRLEDLGQVLRVLCSYVRRAPPARMRNGLQVFSVSVLSSRVTLPFG